MQWLIFLCLAVSQGPSIDQQIATAQREYHHASQLAQQERQKLRDLHRSDPTTLNLSQAEYERQQQAAEAQANQYARQAQKAYTRLQQLYRQRRTEPQSAS